ncbi:MAG: hypothetical protein BMS9Abin29_1135 [Gemmatimonadota bacterium]|nr:MAG: hypothetical protein BMS9Abin29_1135 [Gemmatimonadota bacterium]
MFNGRTPTLESNSSQQEQLTIARNPHDLHAGRWLAATGLLAAALTAPAPAVYASVPAQMPACEDSAARSIDLTYARWVRLLAKRSEIGERDFTRQAEELVGEMFSLDAMSARILGSRWQRLDEGRRNQFKKALARSLRFTVVEYFDESDVIPALRPAAEEMTVEGDLVKARYWLVKPDWSDWFTFRLADDGSGACGIVDIRRGDRSLLGHLKGQVEKPLQDYSFPYMIAQLGRYGAVVLADFENDTEGELPKGWTWRGSDNDKNKPYRIKVEDGNRYLEATDEGESVILGKEIKWNLNEFPYISFRVRVNQIPEGGDERDNKKVDSAAGLYITYRKKFFGKIPESAKYVWSSTLPIGSAVRREGIGRPWQIVFGSGEEGLGEWRTYVFDLRQAYTDTFGGTAPSKSIGVGILSDANSLKLKAYADYDDIQALREAPPGVTSGVTEILAPIGDE